MTQAPITMREASARFAIPYDVLRDRVGRLRVPCERRDRIVYIAPEDAARLADAYATLCAARSAQERQDALAEPPVVRPDPVPPPEVPLLHHEPTITRVIEETLAQVAQVSRVERANLTDRGAARGATAEARKVAIGVLYMLGISQGRIAAALNKDRTTVTHHLRTLYAPGASERTLVLYQLVRRGVALATQTGCADDLAPQLATQVYPLLSARERAWLDIYLASLRGAVVRPQERFAIVQAAYLIQTRPAVHSALVACLTHARLGGLVSLVAKHQADLHVRRTA